MCTATRPISEYIAGWIIVTCVILILLLPIGISGGNTLRHLLFQDPTRVSVNMRIALWWITDHAPANSVIIANPNEPFVIPLFTGRAMLRAKDYWLSQDDAVAKHLEQAFQGDTKAQQDILAQGSFLFLTKEDAQYWDTSSLTKVADSGDATIYATR